MKIIADTPAIEVYLGKIVYPSEFQPHLFCCVDSLSGESREEPVCIKIAPCLMNIGYLLIVLPKVRIRH